MFSTINNSIFTSSDRDKSPADPKTRRRKLPLLISVPHGGYTVPAELIHRVTIDFHDIFPDSDPCTRTIYGFEDEVFYFHDTDIARAAVDLNRADDDLPPRNPDGVIKSHTILGTEIYRQGSAPSRCDTESLLEKYYYPYHQGIARDLADPALICGLDCHSMLEFPPQDNDSNGSRPFLCLSNCGDAHGNASDADITCSPDLINLLADCLRSVFPEEADNILLNDPFKGGHVSRSHARSIPWIQVELNRRAYLEPCWFDPISLRVDDSRLLTLRRRFLQAFTFFSEEAAALHSVQSAEPIHPTLFPGTSFYS